MHVGENPLDIGLNPVGKQALVTPQPHQEKTKNQLQNGKEKTQEAIVTENKTVFMEKKF